MKLKRQIVDLEKKNIDTKSWQMTGEVFSSARPENSLLQETLEFDYMTRQGMLSYIWSRQGMLSYIWSRQGMLYLILQEYV